MGNILKNKWVLGVAGIFILIIIRWIALGWEEEIPTQPAPDSASQPSTPEEGQITLEEKLKKEGIILAISSANFIGGENRVIRVEVTTNLPDGTSLSADADSPNLLGWAHDRKTVENGTATFEIRLKTKLVEGQAGVYDIKVMFSPWHNAEAITSIVGQKGERIKEIGVTQGVVNKPDDITGIIAITDSTSITIESEDLQATEQKSSDQELTTATKRKIFNELAMCESEADVKATKYYDSMCERCPEFIEANLLKMVDKMHKLEEDCEDKVMEKYGITEEIKSQITLEGLELQWELPAYSSFPACCDY